MHGSQTEEAGARCGDCVRLVFRQRGEVAEEGGLVVSLAELGVVEDHAAIDVSADGGDLAPRLSVVVADRGGGQHLVVGAGVAGLEVERVVAGGCDVRDTGGRRAADRLV